MLADQAAWHLSVRLIIPPNITLVTFAGKVPGPEPADDVWQFMGDNWLSNHVFDIYDPIVDPCCDAWNRLVDWSWRIMSIGMIGQPVLITESWY